MRYCSNCVAVATPGAPGTSAEPFVPPPRSPQGLGFDNNTVCAFIGLEIVLSVLLPWTLPTLISNLAGLAYVAGMVLMAVKAPVIGPIAEKQVG